MSRTYLDFDLAIVREGDACAADSRTWTFRPVVKRNPKRPAAHQQRPVTWQAHVLTDTA